MPHTTLTRFGAPDTVVRRYAHWSVLARPAQITTGSLVIVAHDDEARRWPALAPEAFAELATVTRDVEATLDAAVGCEKVNYLMLMMSDPHVHFHVLPRYPGERTLAGVTLADAAWPKAPDIGAGVALEPDRLAALVAELRARWSGA